MKEGNRLDCPSCDLTLYFNPTCSAAALIFDSQNRLLIIERARDPSKGKFAVPGGFTDHGERLEEVVIREVKEEINLDLKFVQFYASFPNSYLYRGINYAVTDTYFLAHVDGFDDIEGQDDEVSGIHFVDPSEIPDEQWAFPSLRNVIKKYLVERSAG